MARNRGLDSLRGLAILLVLGVHALLLSDVNPDLIKVHVRAWRNSVAAAHPRGMDF